MGDGVVLGIETESMLGMRLPDTPFEYLMFEHKVPVNKKQNLSNSFTRSRFFLSLARTDANVRASPATRTPTPRVRTAAVGLDMRV